MLEDVGEISEILGRSYGLPEGVEEEDLDAELACLEDDWAAEDLSAGAALETAAPQEQSQQQPAYLSSLPVQPAQQPVQQSRALNSAYPPAAPNANAMSYI